MLDIIYRDNLESTSYNGPTELEVCIFRLPWVPNTAQHLFFWNQMVETLSVWFPWHILEYSLDPVVCYISQLRANKDYGTLRLHMAEETKDTDFVNWILDNGL